MTDSLGGRCGSLWRLVVEVITYVTGLQILIHLSSVQGLLGIVARDVRLKVVVPVPT